MQEMESNVMETFTEEVDGLVVIKQEYEDKLKALKKQKDEIEGEIKSLSSQITNELKTKFTSTKKVGAFNFVVKGGDFTFEFDESRFKEENLALYITYLKPKQNKISYQLVSATRGKKDV